MKIKPPCWPDTGTGIAEEDLLSVFIKINSVPAGHGMGLAIARQIIKLHEATADVASACGYGFRLKKNNRQEVK
ncbi:ATP-binding protein [Sporomusa acidovorans]|uniref:ATP-binding protein n=1 Tax=Sporomusa acidovorans TaxID=112900 RepID=UPI001160AA75